MTPPALHGAAEARDPTQGDTVSAETIRLCLPQWNPDAASAAAAAAEIAGLAAAQGGFSPRPPAGEVVPGASAGGIPAVSGAAATPERPTNMKDLEREHILATLREFSGSRKKTVEKLGISERTLRYKLQQYREEGYDC